MIDVNCPYCNAGNEINHDDGYGYAEDEIFEQECHNCDKTFIYTTSISFYHEAKKAPCKNGEEHNWQTQQGCPKGYQSNFERCSCCDEKRCKNNKLIYDVKTDSWKGIHKMKPLSELKSCSSGQ